MDFRKLSLAATALVALSPVLANAAPEDAALSACVRAFADKIMPAGADAPSVKVAYPQQHVASPILDYYARSFTFTMSAKNIKTGAEFAQATCEANIHGEILTLSTKSDPSVTTLAAR
jgi:hypothetical protein